MSTPTDTCREAAKLLRLFQNKMGPSRVNLDKEDTEVWNRINRCCADLGLMSGDMPPDKDEPVGEMGKDGKINPPGLTREQYEGLGFGKPDYPHG